MVVGMQTGHTWKMLTLIKNDNFLYRHFKRKGHTPANILVQPVEKITYDANSTSRFKIIKDTRPN